MKKRNADLELEKNRKMSWGLFKQVTELNSRAQENERTLHSLRNELDLKEAMIQSMRVSVCIVL